MHGFLSDQGLDPDHLTVSCFFSTCGDGSVVFLFSSLILLIMEATFCSSVVQVPPELAGSVKRAALL